ncbi:hypothetical protein DBV15_03474 [Temnothorax longispinosus]|uniref:CHK kinase-like domain-containing protein n=1 Tax=Temnothorax longispinosus TaxID=300112 RepID=A0A4S2KEQ3_9HYME|nr:hypothetical protein DBV15_03474 [Temnothorax longispinosus]
MENGSFVSTRSPEDTIKQFEAYLRKYENDDKLVILEAAERPGSKPGDNYMSIMIRTKVVGTRGDGSPYAKTFMTKKIQESNISTLMDLSDLFRMEAHAYTKVLPILGPFGPRCVHADQNTIIMEDLAEKGYVTCERRNLFDLDHTVFALKKLAKLHASALALKINDPRKFDTLNLNIEEIIYKDNSQTSEMRKCTELCVKSIVEYLDKIQPQTQELQTIRNYFTTCIDKTYDAMRRIFTAPKKKYDTICHGDPWVNNLLFLYDNDGRIIDLKMVDYQIIRYTSIATDILYFIYSSVRSSLIERSFESFIKIYHKEFLNALQQSGVTDEKILAELRMEWLESELRTYSFYGLLIGCFLINPILAEEEDVRKFQTIELGVMNPVYQADTSSPMGQKKIDRVKCMALHYYKRFHLGIINDDIEPISITDTLCNIGDYHQCGFWHTVKQFEAYLKKYENDDKLVILEAVERPGSNLGDNYTSTLIRTKLVGTRGDGSPYAKTFMTKMIPDGKFSTLIDLSALSRMEAHTYTKVLPILGSFGPQCVYADKDTIIMEDLAEKGYVNCERRHLLDLDHTVFALKTLARLHASALALKINNPRQFDTLNLHLQEVIYKDDSSKTSVMRWITELALKSIRQLQQSGVTDEKILAELRMDWLESELRTYSFYGLLIGCFLINPILAEEEDVRKFQTIELGVMNPVYQADTSSPMGQKKIDRVKCMALHYYKRFHLGIINDDIEPITDTIKQFEAYLRRYENDDKLVILEAVERPGSNLGDNYTSMDKQKLLVKPTLARLHASALSLKINNPRQFDTLNLHLEEVIYKDNSETSLIRSCTETRSKSIIQCLDMIEPRTQELQTIRDHIATYLDKTYDAMRRMFTTPRQKYDTICHGDPWVNNLLFLHDNDGRIIDLKMVDYQIIRHTSISTDILYLIYGSVRSSLIERSFESLIKIYHNEFLSELRRSRVDEKILAELGTEWLETELRTYSFYGLLVGCFLINPILAEEEDVQQLQTIDFDASSPLYQADINSARNQKKLDRVKCIAFHYYRRFHLGIINDDIEPISVTG